MDASAGVGGLAVRYDENFHLEIEAGGGSVVGRAVIGGLRQEWTHPFTGAELDLHLDSVKPDPAGGFVRTSDIFHLAATIDGVRCRPRRGRRPIPLVRGDGVFHRPRHRAVRGEWRCIVSILDRRRRR